MNKDCLDSTVNILGALSAACAGAAALGTASPAIVAGAIGFAGVGAATAGTRFYSAWRERHRADCERAIASASERIAAQWLADDPSRAVEAGQREAVQAAYARVLPACIGDAEEIRHLVSRASLNGEAIAGALHARLPDDADGALLRRDGPARFFRAAVAGAWTELRQNAEFTATLTSYVQEEMLGRLGSIEAKADTNHDLLVRILANQEREGAASELAAKLDLTEKLILGVAAPYLKGDPDNIEDVVKGIEAALESTVEERRKGLLPSNLGEAVDAVLTKVRALNDEGKLDEATDALEVMLRERAEARAREGAETARLLDRAVAQARLTNNPEAAARHLVERLKLYAPENMFEALRGVWNEWYERGRDKGIAFELEVAIELTCQTFAIATYADQRGDALNGRGNALAVLGQRESGTARIYEAVAAYREALKERTRERVPLDWAVTHNNLGNALLFLGNRESGTARTYEAVAAYREALKEQTRERVPHDWANTQNNLGTALQALGQRESGTSRIDEAIAAYREALKEQTRERVPLDWAMTQCNLGNALKTLGERESDPSRFDEAVAAYREALKERTRERVPYHWALTQENLAILYETISERTRQAEDVARAIGHAEGALEVYREAGATYDIGTCEPLLARCKALHARLLAGDGEAG